MATKEIPLGNQTNFSDLSRESAWTPQGPATFVPVPKAGQQAELALDRFVEEATDWRLILPMIFASPIYQLGKTAAMARYARAGQSLWTRGKLAQMGATMAGFGGEVAFFSVGHRALVDATEGGVAWDAKSMGRDLLTAGLTLGVLKGANHLGQQAFTAARTLRQATPGIFTSGERLAQSALGQGTAYLGLVTAHKLENHLGLTPLSDHENVWLGALSTHLSLGAGGYLGRKLLFGPRLQAMQRRLAEDLDFYQQRLNAPRSLESGGGQSLAQRLKEWLQGPGGGFPPGMVPALAGAFPETPSEKAERFSHIWKMSSQGEGEGNGKGPVPHSSKIFEYYLKEVGPTQALRKALQEGKPYDVLTIAFLKPEGFDAMATVRELTRGDPEILRSLRTQDGKDIKVYVELASKGNLDALEFLSILASYGNPYAERAVTKFKAEGVVEQVLEIQGEKIKHWLEEGSAVEQDIVTRQLRIFSEIYASEPARGLLKVYGLVLPSDRPETSVSGVREVHDYVKAGTVMAMVTALEKENLPGFLTSLRYQPPGHDNMGAVRDVVQRDPELRAKVCELDPREVTAAAEQGDFQALELLAMLATVGNERAKLAQEALRRSHLAEVFIKREISDLLPRLQKGDPEIVRLMRVLANDYESFSAKALLLDNGVSLQASQRPATASVPPSVPSKIPIDQFLKGQKAATLAIIHKGVSPIPANPVPKGAEPAPYQAEAFRIRAPWATEVDVEVGGTEKRRSWTTRHSFLFNQKVAEEYGTVTGNKAWARRGLLAPGMTFMGAMPGIARAYSLAVENHGNHPPIHGVESIEVLAPLKIGESYRVEQSQGLKGKPEGPQTVIQSRNFLDAEGQVLAKSKTFLVAGADFSEIKAKAASEELQQSLPEFPTLVVAVTGEMIDQAAKAFGDYNKVHTDDVVARSMGLPKGRILHGQANLNFADRALQMDQGTLGFNGPFRLETKFEAVAEPGDQLRFYVIRDSETVRRVITLNQRDEVVQTVKWTDLSAQKTGDKLKGEPVLGLDPQNLDYGRAKGMRVDPKGGLKRIREVLADMSPEDLSRQRQVMAPRADQPVFIAGGSDGMGFQVAASLIEAGHRNLVIDFYEPDGPLIHVAKAQKKADIGPDSPLYPRLKRLENVEGLRRFAQEKGARLEAVYQDFVLADSAKGHLRLPESVERALERARRHSPWIQDIIFVNSIAFAPSIVPAPGMPARKGVPSVDPFTGEVRLMDMAGYTSEKYQSTLDNMGVNHKVVLKVLEPYFGPQSLSLFFTWPGGSQFTLGNGMTCIYGGGVLGDAKIFGETAAMRFHFKSMDKGMALGAHKIVNLPSFRSLALGLIPGGFFMGLAAQDVLTQRGVYLDMPQLAPRIFTQALGGENTLRNPAAPIDFASAERVHFPEISGRVQEFQRRVKAEIPRYQESHPGWEPKNGARFDWPTSRRLLKGLVSEEFLAEMDLKHAA